MKMFFSSLIIFALIQISNAHAQGIASITINTVNSPVGVKFDLHADYQPTCSLYVDHYRAVLMDLEPGTMDSYDASDIDPAATHIFEIIFDTPEGAKTIDLCNYQPISWVENNEIVPVTFDDGILVVGVSDEPEQ